MEDYLMGGRETAPPPSATETPPLSATATPAPENEDWGMALNPEAVPHYAVVKGFLGRIAAIGTLVYSGDPLQNGDNELNVIINARLK